jgi:UDP-N-acetylglucosamine 4,6-dehydratase
VLISAEDAWYTVELADRFSIEPSYRYWETERKPLPGSKPVPEEFSYTSNNNSEWMKPEELLPLLGTEKA